MTFRERFFALKRYSLLRFSVNCGRIKFYTIQPTIAIIHTVKQSQTFRKTTTNDVMGECDLFWPINTRLKNSYFQGKYTITKITEL